MLSIHSLFVNVQNQCGFNIKNITLSTEVLPIWTFNASQSQTCRQTEVNTNINTTDLQNSWLHFSMQQEDFQILRIQSDAFSG